MQLHEVSSNYDKAARYYDFLVDITFGRILRLEKYRSYAVDLLGDVDGATVLDLGCGTGRNFPLLVERVGQHGKIIGVDYSEGMLKKARQRVQKQGWRNIELIRDDAASLGAITTPIDAAIAVWCLGIVHDLDTALIRTVDLIRRDGRIAIVDFQKSRPERGLLKWLFPLYSVALQRAGIDSAEDLHDEKLQAKWARGKQVLGKRVGCLHEERYLDGAGLILSAQKSGRDATT